VRHTVDLHPSTQALARATRHVPRARPAAGHRGRAWLNPLSRSLGPVGLVLNPAFDRCPRWEWRRAARRGVRARVVAEALVNAVLAGLRSLQPVWRGQRVLRQSFLMVRCLLTFAARQARYTRYPVTLDRRALDCRSRAGHFLPSGTRPLGVSRCRTSQPPRDHCPGALPEFASSLTAPFVRHTSMMATLRVSLLVATLLGLAFLATPREAVAGPIPGQAAFSQCLKYWPLCFYREQRCAECVASCGEAHRKSPMTITAGLRHDSCRTAQA